MLKHISDYFKILLILLALLIFAVPAIYALIIIYILLKDATQAAPELVALLLVAPIIVMVVRTSERFKKG